MQVSVETTGTLGRRMTVAIPAEEVEKEVKQRLTRLARTTRLPGFRPGRAPLRVIESKYGGQVLGEVAGTLIEDSLQKALAEHELVPAGVPDVAPRKLERGADLEYVADFEVYPEVKKTDIAGIEIERPMCEIADADLDKTVESMRRQRVSWAPAERNAEAGDQLVIDFKGTIDGEPFPGSEAEDYTLVLGEGQLLAEFEDGLAQAAAGDERQIDLTFPEDYQGREVAGKQARFSVTVKAVNRPVLPELDADFARSFGVDSGDVEQLRAEVRKNLERELADRVRSITRQRVLDALRQANDMELPRKLVDQEITRLIESSKAMLSRQGVKLGDIEPDRSKFEDDARQRVTLGLVLYEIVRQHKIQPDDERVRRRVEELAAGYQDPDAFVQWYYSDKKRLSEVESVVLEEQVVEKLLDGAKVKDARVSFDELMQRSA